MMKFLRVINVAELSEQRMLEFEARDLSPVDLSRLVSFMVKEGESPPEMLIGEDLANAARGKH